MLTHVNMHDTNSAMKDVATPDAPVVSSSPRGPSLPSLDVRLPFLELYVKEPHSRRSLSAAHGLFIQ